MPRRGRSVLQSSKRFREVVGPIEIAACYQDVKAYVLNGGGVFGVDAAIHLEVDGIGRLVDPLSDGASSMENVG